MLDGCELDLHEALAVAVDAAKAAGLIIWQAVQQRRALVAAAHAPTTRDQTTTAAPTRASTTSVQSGLVVETKSSSIDLVTQYDKRCDDTITRALQRYSRRVEHAKPGVRFAFITEELNPDTVLGDDATWIVDPIDGTMSFVHSLPDCCVSIGLTWRKQPVLAVVFCPFLSCGALIDHFASDLPMHDYYHHHHHHDHHRHDDNNNKDSGAMTASSPQQQQQGSGADNTSSSPAAARRAADKSALPECYGDLYTAIRGHGCFLNGVRVHVNAATTPRTALCVFSFPFNVVLTPDERDADAAAREAARQRKMSAAVDAATRIRAALFDVPVQGVRLHGSAVISLAHIAAGRLSLYMEPSTKAWDVCAGALLVTEAGGCVCNLHGAPLDLTRDTTIVAAATPALATMGASLCVRENYGQYWLLPPHTPGHNEPAAEAVAASVTTSASQQQQQQQQKETNEEVQGEATA